MRKGLLFASLVAVFMILGCFAVQAPKAQGAGCNFDLWWGQCGDFPSYAVTTAQPQPDLQKVSIDFDSLNAVAKVYGYVLGAKTEDGKNWQMFFVAQDALPSSSSALVHFDIERAETKYGEKFIMPSEMLRSVIAWLNEHDRYQKATPR
jgi:hypothetical protein